MSVISAFSPGFFDPTSKKNTNQRKKSSGGAERGRVVGDGPPFPVHAVFQLAPGGINFVVEADYNVFLSGRPALQPGSQLTRMTITGQHNSDSEVRKG